MKVLVYTSITNNHDNLKLQPTFPEDAEIEYKAYLDVPTMGKIILPYNWAIHSAVELFKEDKRNCQMPKILSHMYTDDYDCSVWIDGSIILKTSITKLIKDNLTTDVDIALLKHSERNCIYKESWDCKHFNLDKHELINEQMNFYKSVGYPEFHGLSETPLIIRRNTKNVVDFNTLWWSILCRYSKRDQLSFDFVRWVQSTPVNYIKGNIHDNEYFKIEKHKVLREHERG